jgi:hypothetical protein
MTIGRLQHTFVDSFPGRLEPGTVYVSIPYSIVTHLCCCGCGNEAVTPLGPTEWKLTFDGESVSLYPSIGNWSFPCRSHYWIRGNAVEWAPRWSDRKITANRSGGRLGADSLHPPVPETGEDQSGKSIALRLKSALHRLTRSLRG